tara:strand:+ start:845 stop:1498 length:654 start_codon:yes stop_codon:yes gene_type:complete
LEGPIITEDGSHSLVSPLFNQQYHSLQGALVESIHIYINLGIKSFINDLTTISIFEMGFGTGLNALLSWKLADELKIKINYTTVEAFPISPEIAATLNYEILAQKTGLMELHTCPWSESIPLSPYFCFQKEKAKLEDLKITQCFDVIFYDAFDPRAQPELWTSEIFSKIAAHTNTGGVLVTYSSKGIVKRALAQAGFTVTRQKGPGRKTHVLKATKN